MTVTAKDFRFFNCTALEGEQPMALVAAGLNAPENEEDESTCVFLMDASKQTWNLSVTGWPSIGLLFATTPEGPLVMNIGVYGHIQYYYQDTYQEGQLPDAYPIRVRGAKVIGDTIYAYGLGPYIKPD